MPAPDSYFLEAEFTAGVWTDISTYMDGGVGASVTYGRSTQYGPPQAATLTVTLENTDGRFTPLRQTLKDLVTVHPYYPNLVPRKRIRWGYVKAAVRYVRFTGYVRGWPTGMVNDGSYEQVTLTAVDRSLQLQRYTMKGPIFDGINSSAFRQNLYTYWPLTDSAARPRAPRLTAVWRRAAPLMARWSATATSPSCSARPGQASATARPRRSPRRARRPARR
jgi:hypothetical protein